MECLVLSLAQVSSVVLTISIISNLPIWWMRKLRPSVVVSLGGRGRGL